MLKYGFHLKGHKKSKKVWHCHTHLFLFTIRAVVCVSFSINRLMWGKMSQYFQYFLLVITENYFKQLSQQYLTCINWLDRKNMSVLQNDRRETTQGQSQMSYFSSFRIKFVSCSSRYFLFLSCKWTQFKVDYFLHIWDFIYKTISSFADSCWKKVLLVLWRRLSCVLCVSIVNKIKLNRAVVVLRKETRS